MSDADFFIAFGTKDSINLVQRSLALLCHAFLSFHLRLSLVRVAIA